MIKYGDVHMLSACWTNLLKNQKGHVPSMFYRNELETRATLWVDVPKFRTNILVDDDNFLFIQLKKKNLFTSAASKVIWGDYDPTHV